MATDTLSRPSLSQVMLQNGIVYFCTLVSLNIISIVLSTQAIYVADSDGSYAVSFVDPISAVLSCHFLLNLRQTSEILADASAATVSSLNFGERNDPPQIPPLSPFLNSLGGPIFPQIDMQGEDGRFETEPSDDGELIPSAYMVL
ncbi:hypothetical protein BD413DRAFT_13309 [Trametes elegans]|nr:hypothetical protein BD413DRAFT_13309 [Trametes elegans]